MGPAASAPASAGSIADVYSYGCCCGNGAGAGGGA